MRPDEWPAVGTLFGYFFLLTATQHLLKPARTAFFLTTAGSENLPWAYIATAIVSALATIVYGRWVAPLERRLQIIGSLVFVVFTIVGFRIMLVNPTAWSARRALSRPEPGPLTSTSSVRTPCSAAFLPASSAAT